MSLFLTGMFASTDVVRGMGGAGADEDAEERGSAAAEDDVEHFVKHPVEGFAAAGGETRGFGVGVPRANAISKRHEAAATTRFASAMEGVECSRSVEEQSFSFDEILFVLENLLFLKMVEPMAEPGMSTSSSSSSIFAEATVYDASDSKQTIQKHSSDSLVLIMGGEEDGQRRGEGTKVKKGVY